MEVEMCRKCTPVWHGANHMPKSKCTKHLNVGALLKVEMLKKRTLLWREAHFDVKCTKCFSFGALLEVEICKKYMPLWRGAYFQVKTV